MLYKVTRDDGIAWLIKAYRIHCLASLNAETPQEQEREKHKAHIDRLAIDRLRFPCTYHRIPS